MCGICGKLTFRRDQTVDPALVRGMMATIEHRGPDDEGLYASGNVVLGHRRLSIIDLNTGKQPLSNETGTVWIVFNGEIYNYRELRTGLIARGHKLRTETDTEVIVHLYEELGPELLERLRGMFAFALWDETSQTLLLARDRVGIKPLYYCLQNEALIFGSEIKAILADPSVPRQVRPEIVDRFLTFLYLPGPDTTFENIYKLSPGHYLLARHGQIKVEQYWDLKFAENSSRRSERQVAEELTQLLAQTIRDHMISDVPVGVLLSGGVDSTGVLSFALEETEKPVSSFTIGFEGEKVVDERPYARLAAQRFGTQHYETTITARDFADFLPRYIWHMEEPVCEPPAVALYFVSELAKRHVKVLLSGEGGDEAFAGYPEYRGVPYAQRLKEIVGPLSRPLGRVLSRLGRVSGEQRLLKYAPLLSMPLEDYYYSRTATPKDTFRPLKYSFYSDDYRREVSGSDPASILGPLFANVAGLDCLNRLLYLDTKTWLPDDLLIKADKITMANSIELRVPLLDHKVLEFAASLPAGFKVRGRNTKRILKHVLTKRIPSEIIQRKKAGFPVPYKSWIQRELRDLTADTLLSRRCLQRGYFEPAALRRLVDTGTNGTDRSKQLFSLLVLELWHREFIDPRQERVVAPQGWVPGHSQYNGVC